MVTAGTPSQFGDGGGMSRRRQRVRRLWEIVDRQELTARATMVRSESELRDAIIAKQQSIQRTEVILRQELRPGLRQALTLASARVGQEQDQVIELHQEQVQANHAAWLEQRRRSGSIGKLLERIVEREELATDRATERELADLISSRTALAMARPTASISLVGGRP